MSGDLKKTLVKVSNLKTYFPVKKGVFKKTVGYVKAVDDVSIEIFKGETLGVVGESGCGKTTFGKTILNLYQAADGSVEYRFDDGFKDITKLKSKDMDEIRKKMQIVFQDPYSSLNPSFTIFSSLEEPLIKFGVKSKKDRIKMIGDILEKVNLPREYMTRYPNEFSGGQRQRIGIARALLVEPELIVCDEAVSALDVSIQAQVLHLLKKLQQERDLTYLFITHDLAVVEYVADRVAVMYLGRIVELAKTETLFENTLHPYTAALLSAIPVAELAKKKKRTPLTGDVPSPVNPPKGCTFHPRCKHCQDICKTAAPELRCVEEDGGQHYVACHFAGQIK